MYKTYTITNIYYSINVIMYTLYNVQNVHYGVNKKTVHIFGVFKFYT